MEDRYMEGKYCEMVDRYYELCFLIQDFLYTLTETEGHVEGEWPEYEALLKELGD